MRGPAAALGLLAALVLPPLAWPVDGAAGESARSLRLLGEAPGAEGSVPKRFVLDLTLTPGDGRFETEVEGWFAGLAPDIAPGDVSGRCVEAVCALTADLSDGELALSGTLMPPSGAGKFDFDDGEQAGEARFSALGDREIPGLGSLAPPGAVTAEELTEILAWNGFETGFNNADLSGPPTEFERDVLTTWQGAGGRHMNGLILAAELAALREGALAQKARTGWTPLGDPARGWSAGVPAILLPVAGRSGPEQRFASADGKAVLVIAIEPPRTRAAFDALVKAETARPDGRENVGYTRVNDEMEVSYTEGGVRRVAAYHSREGGFARAVFSFPAGSETYEPFETLLIRSLKVTEDLKGP